MDRSDEFFLVDTLEGPYYPYSRLPVAIDIPVDGIEHAPQAISDKDAQIVFYCMEPP